VDCRAKLLGPLEGREQSGLCALHPYVMNRLGVDPGDYVHVSPVESSTPHEDQVLLRVWPRTRDAWSECDDALCFRCDGEIISQKGWRVDEVFTVRRCERVQAAISVQLVPSQRLSENEKRSLPSIIVHKGWPLYQGALYALNVDGEPLVFRVVSDHAKADVLTVGCLIQFNEPEDLAKHTHMINQQLELDRLHQEKILLTQQIKDMERNLRRLEEDCSQIEKALRASEEKARQTQEALRDYQEKILIVVQQKASEEQNLKDLEERVRPLRSEEIPEINIPEAEERERQTRQAFEKALQRWEESLKKMA